MRQQLKLFAGSIVIASALLLAGVPGGEPVGARSAPALDLGVSGRANANPSIAARGSFVGVAWAARTPDGVTDIYAAMSRDGGRSFRAPVRVNRVAGEASVSGEQPPRIALVPRAANNPSVVIMWTAKATAGTRLVSARSTDGGQSFGPAEPVHGSEASGNRGWEAMAVNLTGELVAVWLDHRAMPARPAGAGGGGAHQHGEGSSGQATHDGAARALLSQIFFANLSAPASVRAIASGVCYCCKTSIATGTGGRIVATWRHVYPGNVRDIALALSSDGGRTFAAPVRVSADNWVLNACPENGPAVAIDKRNAIHVVWPTLVPGAPGAEPTMSLFYTMSRDGRRFTERLQIPTEGLPRHPQIVAVANGTLVAAWDEHFKGVRRIVLARGAIGSKGAVHFTRDAVNTDGSEPVVASLSDGVILAWIGGATGQTVVRALRFPTAK